MTELEINYFENNPNINVFLKVGSVFFYENAIIPAKNLSIQSGLPIEVLKREDYIKSIEQVETPKLIDTENVIKNKKRKTNK